MAVLAILIQRKLLDQFERGNEAQKIKNRESKKIPSLGLISPEGQN
jgi:hypothetical protein